MIAALPLSVVQDLQDNALLASQSVANVRHVIIAHRWPLAEARSSPSIAPHDAVPSTLSDEVMG
jgi:hypothetical protein